MKFLFLIAVACIALKATYSLPITEPATNTLSTIYKKNSSHNRLLQAVKQYTNIFVSETEHIITNVLQFVPTVEAYEESRQTLSKYLQTNKLFSTKLSNCVWNIVDLNRDMRVLLDYFGSAYAAPERKAVMKLLEENGFTDLKGQVEIILVRFVNGDLGSTDGVNEDYC